MPDNAIVYVRAAVVALVACLLSPTDAPRASPTATIRLEWNEVVFGVEFAPKELRLGSTSWTLTATLRNRERKPLFVRHADFGLVAENTDGDRRFVPCTTYRPAFPRRLPPDGQWKGSISCPPMRPRPRLLRFFVAEFSRSATSSYGRIGWTTRHSVVLQKR